MAFLEISALNAFYGKAQALHNVTISAQKGEIIAIVGANGAGKSTLFDSVMGLTKTTGSITLDGTPIGSNPTKAVQQGVGYAPERFNLFPYMSVRDNLLVAAYPTKWYSFILDMLHLTPTDPEIEARVDWALDIMGLTDEADAMPTDLPHGRRKLVGVARALAGKPDLILLDEPAAGLDTAESQNLGRHLREFLDHDMSVFLIDHDMGLVLGVCDYIYVLDFGKIIAQGTPAEVRENPAVKAAYLGAEAGEVQAAAGAAVASAQVAGGEEE